MVVHRGRKVRKMRGSHTHGWGAKKKHRGKGSRGGKGMGGSGKRAGHYKSYIIKHYGLEYFGKHGFHRPQVYKKNLGINIRDLPLTEQIDLRALGYQKLLAKGIPRMKHTITALQCSKKAKEKIERGGGKVILLTDHDAR